MNNSAFITRVTGKKKFNKIIKNANVFTEFIPSQIVATHLTKKLK